MTLCILAEHCYAECRLCWLSLMLCVTYKPLMLSLIISFPLWMISFSSHKYRSYLHATHNKSLHIAALRLKLQKEVRPEPWNTKGGSITVPLTSGLTGLESTVTTNNFCFYFQNRVIQTSQRGGQQYSGTSSFSIPCPNLEGEICSWWARKGQRDPTTGLQLFRWRGSAAIACWLRHWNGPMIYNNLQRGVHSFIIIVFE
jgi:hypothetical protein